MLGNTGRCIAYLGYDIARRCPQSFVAVKSPPPLREDWQKLCLGITLRVHRGAKHQYALFSRQFGHDMQRLAAPRDQLRLLVAPANLHTGTLLPTQREACLTMGLSFQVLHPFM